MSKVNLTYKKLILYTILTSLILVFIFTLGYGYYLKKKTIDELAKNEAKKTSLLIFENLYTAMSKGATESDIVDVIKRLNSVNNDVLIRVYKSKEVAELFQDDLLSKEKRENDKFIIDAMSGIEKTLKYDQHHIRYAYPIMVESKCVICHRNMKEKDVAGVIDLEFDVLNTSTSLNNLVNSLAIFFLLCLIGIFIFIYINLKVNIVNPIGSFIDTIKNLMSEKKLTRRVELKTNIAEIKNIESFFNQLLESLQTQFYQDQLTGLKNRRKIFEDVQDCKYCYLAIINIDSFNQINDFYGNKIGDLILVEIGKRLSALLYNSGCELYRYGGDEYAIVTKNFDSAIDFEIVVLNAIKCVEEKIIVEIDKEISLNATAGIAIGGDDILMNASVALKKAKKNKKRYLIYEENMFAAKEYENNIKWSNILKEAIQDNRLIAFYQPIKNTKTDKIEKYETLIRLRDKDGSIISPYFFLDIAKKIKLYPYITKKVIDESFKTFESNEYEFSINLSVNDILNEETIEYIKDKVKNSPASKRVVFELLESEGIENYLEVINFIDFIKIYGAKIAIDDFGTGYSSFEHLIELKIDYIKIDATMIKNIDKDKNIELIAETIVEFANKLGIETIAEFVHTQTVYNKVKEIGVTYSQGYFLGEPREKIIL